jgi:hypothetical protein
MTDLDTKKVVDAINKLDNVAKQLLVAELKSIADKKAWCDDEDFMVNDYAGGNIDDAYSGGYDDGEIIMARHILTQLKENAK